MSNLKAKKQHDEYSDVTNKKSLVFKTNQRDHFSSANTLSRLDSAVYNAESVDYPNRYYLLELYHDILSLDGHLKSVIKHRKTRVTGLKFNVTKANGTSDDKATKLFNSQWFMKFLDLALDAIFYGNSLIEINKLKGGVLSTVLIPRENVIPEFKQIKTEPYSQTGDEDYSAPFYSKRLIDINNNNDNRNLGEFLTVAKLVLFKQEVLMNWSQHIEKFGQPMTVATTDSQDDAELANIAHFVKDLGRSGWMVKNSSTEIDFEATTVNSASSKMYLDFTTTMNEEISKVILGGTMVTDSGSSRSQSEVHERGLNLFTKADVSFIESIINNHLFDVLRSHGMLSTKGLTFSFVEPDMLTVDEKIKIDTFLMENFDVKNIEYFEKRYGVDLNKQKDSIADGGD